MNARCMLGVGRIGLLGELNRRIADLIAIILHAKLAGKHKFGIGSQLRFAVRLIEPNGLHLARIIRQHRRGDPQAPANNARGNRLAARPHRHLARLKISDVDRRRIIIIRPRQKIQGVRYRLQTRRRQRLGSFGADAFDML